jgi:hypothetical protein
MTLDLCGAGELESETATNFESRFSRLDHKIWKRVPEVQRLFFWVSVDILNEINITK